MSFPQMLKGVPKRNRAFKAVFILTVVVASFIAFWYTGMAKVFEKDSMLLRAEFLECFTKESEGAVVSCVNSNMARWVDTYGIAVDDELLYYQNIAGADSTCHLVGHVIGEAFFARYGIEALGQSTFACYASVQHGILGAYQTMFGPEAFIASAFENDLCGTVRNNENSYLLCVHGLGHAFLLATENFDYLKASDLCWQLDLTSQFLKRNCVSGVFMELFDGTIGGSHYTPPKELYVKKGDVFYPCTSADILERDRSSCFSQVWAIASQNLDIRGRSRIGLCEEHLPERWRVYCARSVGLSVAGRNADTVSRITSVCRDTRNTTLKNECLSGALFYVRYNPVEPSKKTARFCSALTKEEYAGVCGAR